MKEIINNTVVLFHFISYYIGRGIRWFFHFTPPPFDVKEYINNKRSFVEIYLYE